MGNNSEDILLTLVCRSFSRMSSEQIFLAGLADSQEVLMGIGD